MTFAVLTEKTNLLNRARLVRLGVLDHDHLTDEQWEEVQDLEEDMERDETEDAIELRATLITFSRDTRTPITMWMEMDPLELMMLWVPAMNKVGERIEESYKEMEKKATAIAVRSRG